MDDLEIVVKATELLKDGVWSRFSLARKLGMSKEKLDRINKEHNIPKYPKPMNTSQAAKHNRLVTGDKWGGKFKLRGSPNFG